MYTGQMIQTWALERQGLLLEHDVPAPSREVVIIAMKHILMTILVWGQVRSRVTFHCLINLAMCEALKLSITPKKTLWATQEPTRILGIEIDGTGELRPGSYKMVELVDTTVVFCR